MRPLRLAVAAIARGLALGGLLGAAVGAGYGLLASLLFLVYLFLKDETARAGAFTFGYQAPLFGLIAGVLFGTPLGAALGGLNSLIISITTHVWYSSAQDRQRYRRVMRTIATATTVLGTLLGVQILLMNASIFNVGALLLLGSLPALLAALCAWRVSLSFTDWYIQRMP
jgi:hypothetical protein